ncbi:MAG: hypothetical protein A2Z99_20940 [Treponema sp. GWB1_62_6]|nr:MAG: hypothetical protein A2Z99_20940 [Treponema sp. GWB1_62_6]OHE69933.1 MAG: hypothetical protein A2001_10800 [Treponema sp. GWC1_61_84]OHE70560.1 MAG: hypothetical protein A2413_10680 [Treponema sp. RIFOXYC1_FULL_61_9]
MANVAERVALHRAFWNGEKQAHPIAALRVAPDFFFSRHFRAAEKLLVPDTCITADMLEVDRFMNDYERMFRDSELAGQDAFWTAEPYTGIPWMEAILGCRVCAGDSSFTSERWLNFPGDLDKVRVDPENPWFRKYLEFTTALVDLSKGRFPVGMPIMRGPSDVAGALMGQTEMVFALNDEPERMKEFFMRIAEAFRFVIDAQNALIPPFQGGTALGFYHVYCPGPSIWYQEDLSALMSPAMYSEFLKEAEQCICQGKSYTAIHLHPSSFFILDALLAKDELKAIEVNKDVGGPCMVKMIPYLQKIQKKKRLIIWGDLDEPDIRLIKKNLSSDGLFLHIIAPTVHEAKRLGAIVREVD